MSTLFDTYMANNKVEELSDDQVKDLLKEYRYDENLDARDSIIKNFYPMIKRLINTWLKYHLKEKNIYLLLVWL